MFWRRRKQEDFRAEVEAHIELEAERLKEQGLSDEEACAAARRAFGNVTRAQERFYESGRWVGGDQLRQDIRYGLRQLRRSPGFTAAAVVTLALGIGANTSIFSVVNAMMLRPLPVRDPAQLVEVAQGGPTFSYPAFRRFRDENHVFLGVLGVYWQKGLDATINGQAETLDAQLVSGNFFSLLGVDAVSGRTFTTEEDGLPGRNPVAVISYGYWKKRFGLDPSVVGKSITLNKTPFTILGVTPPEFSGIWLGFPADVYVPMTMVGVLHEDRSWLNNTGTHWIHIMGRLKPGTSPGQALADLALIHGETLEDDRTVNRSEAEERFLNSLRLAVVPAESGLTFDLRQQFSQPLAILMAMVGFVLLIACINVANLSLARAATRQKEIAVRLAIGAGRRRLIRLLLTESLLLASTGGAAGYLLAYWSGTMLASLVSMAWGLGWGSPRLDLQPDPRVLAFTAGVSLLVGVVFGLIPAIRATRPDLTPALKENGRKIGASRSSMGLGKTLVVSQVALSLLLLFGAGLLVRTLRNLENLDPGFNRHNVLEFSLDATKAGYGEGDVPRVYQALLERFDAIPGVRSAGLSVLAPITGGGGWDGEVWVDGYTPRPNEDRTVYLNAVSPGYFETIGTELRLGRDFEPRDSRSAVKVAIINQAMARYFFGNDNPIGRRFGPGMPGDKGRQEFEIIGVVEDSKYETLRETVPRTAYLDCFQGPLGGMTVSVRTAMSATALVPQIRSEISAVDKNVRVGDFTTLEEHVNTSLGHERVLALLSALFGILTLAIASVGLYGLMSYAVARRTSEIGIRMALGADRGQVLKMVVRESMLLIAAGVTLGLPLVLAAGRLISGQLFGLKPADPTTIVGAIGLLAAVGAFAVYSPARRATKVDPMVALRYE